MCKRSRSLGAKENAAGPRRAKLSGCIIIDIEKPTSEVRHDFGIDDQLFDRESVVQVYGADGTDDRVGSEVVRSGQPPAGFCRA